MYVKTEDGEIVKVDGYDRFYRGYYYYEGHTRIMLSDKKIVATAETKEELEWEELENENPDE